MGYFTIKILIEYLTVYKDAKTRFLNTRIDRLLSYENYFV